MSYISEILATFFVTIINVLHYSRKANEEMVILLLK